MRSLTHVRRRRRGGQELSDEVQDRPEQNAGYDAAVRNGNGTPIATHDDAEVIDLERAPRDADLDVEFDVDTGDGEDEEY
jgi:hypothetical protein